MKKGLLALVAVLAIFFGGLILVFAVGSGQIEQSALAACQSPGPAIVPVVQFSPPPGPTHAPAAPPGNFNVPAGSVAGYSGVQLQNAAAISKAGADQGLDAKGQTIGVMTAMGESALQEIAYGDAAGPDSRGLFQQRANGAWGSLADRMNPYISATNFFKVLKQVPGWESMSPTLAAHAVQRNADPFYYTKYWNPAVAVISALGGGLPPGIAPGTGDAACTATAPGQVAPTAGGWAIPTVGSLTSGFSQRVNPVTGQPEFHLGQDIAAPCGTPIYAAKAGVVISSGPATGFGNWIRVDTGPDPLSGGADVITIYGHEWNDGLLVRVGDHVTAGQQIGKVGANGQSTGCHDHFQIMVGGVAVNPIPFMAAHGAPLTSTAKQ